ncbi:MAG: hypothetical protein KF733_03305 [Fimbriimonadaceae bacterium]|nr:MAG: hypothetical protein KF733_03305 [Fimbriimonadaceae bacterium]
MNEVEALSFLAGDWVCEQHGGLFYETWSEPEGGTLQGHGRLVVGGKTTFMEFLAVEPGEDGLVMHILIGKPSRGTPRHARFLLQSAAGREAVFVRLGGDPDDFPAQIAYSDRGGLTCLLTGRGKEETYAFRRCP